MKRTNMLCLWMTAVVVLIIAVYMSYVFSSNIRSFREANMEITEREGRPKPPLHLAILWGETQEAVRLIESGVDVDELAYGLFGRGTIDTALEVAVFKQNKEVIESLIAHGANVNKGHPLTSTVVRNLNDIAVLLLDNGADINGDRQDGVPWPLVAAAKNGDCQMVKLLIDRGIDLFSEPNGATASVMYNAAIEGHDKVVSLLISEGVSVKVPRTPRSRTPLHGAALSLFGNAKIAEVLIEHGVEIDRKDSDGKTALDYAKERKHSAMVAVLRKHGAKE